MFFHFIVSQRRREDVESVGNEIGIASKLYMQRNTGDYQTNSFMWNPGFPSKCVRGGKTFEIDSMIFSIPNPPECWLWMTVIESSV